MAERDIYRDEKLKYEQLSAIAKISPVGIYRTDEEGNCVYVNQKWCEIAGISAENALGTGWVSAVHPDDTQLVMDEWKSYSQHQTIFQLEFRFQHADNSEHWVLSQALPEYDDNGMLIGHLGTVTNISDQKITEQQLKERSDLNHRLIENSPSAILIQTLDKKIVYANKVTAELLNAPSETDLIGESTRRFSLPENEPEIAARVQHIFKTGQPASRFEQDFKCYDGSIKTGLSKVIPFEWEGETAILTIVNDITEHKESVKALQTSEKNLRFFVKNAPVSVAMLDEHLNYVACSSNWLSDWWKGDETITTDSIIGLNHYELFADVTDTWKKVHKRCLKGAYEASEDDKFMTADGKTEWLRWDVRPWEKLDGKIGGIIIFTEFITERKIIQREIEESRLKLTTTLENVPGMVYSAQNDETFSLTFVSSGSLEITGYLPIEFFEPQRLSIIEIMHPDDREGVFNQLQEALKSKQIFELNYRIFTKSKELRYLFERGQGIYNEDDQLESVEGIILDVTKQKVYEAELKNKEKNLAEAQKVAGLGSWEWNIETGDIYWSDEYFRICGEPPQSFVPVYEVAMSYIHPDDQEPLIRAIEKTIETGVPYSLEKRIIRRDGTIRKVLSRASVRSHNKGKTLVGSMLDMTERKRTEEALQESEARNRALVNALPDLIFINTKEGVYVDAQITKEYDSIVPKEELIGKNIDNFFDKQTAAKFRDKFKLALSTNQTQQVEYSISTDGKRSYFEGRIVKYRDNQVLTVVRDITKSKEDEISAFESERRFYKVFNISPIPVTITKFENSQIIDVNNKFLDLVKMNRDEVIGCTTLELGFWINPEERKEFVEELVQEGKVYGLQTKIRTKDGTDREVILSAELIQLDGESNILTMIFDISEQKKVEKELLLLANELMSTNKELSQFAYITSHNLRAPVVNIDSLLKFYDPKKTDLPENEMIFEKIVLSVEQLKSSLQDLIQLVAIKDNKEKTTERIVFADIVEVVKRNLHVQIEEAKAVIKTDFEQVEALMVNKAIIESIIQNLVSNAIKYTGKDSPVIQLRTNRYKNGVMLLIKDNGIGMDLNKMGDRLFGMYQRFHENKEGKGLGLYIVKSQIESIGGSIEVESKPQKGTTFKVYFTDKN
ncbi:MAG: PAS domain S-box protein [Bacteroidota bacterium]